MRLLINICLFNAFKIKLIGVNRKNKRMMSLYLHKHMFMHAFNIKKF